MNEQHHDHAIEQAVDLLTINDPASLLAEFPHHEADDLERAYSELLGLLPFADAPQMPQVGIKTALLERVSLGGSGDPARLAAHTAETGSVDTPPASQSVHDTALATADPGSESRASVVPISRRASGWNSWSIAMAAMLGLCVISLAFLAGRIREQRQQIGVLQHSVQLSSELAEQQNQLVSDQLRDTQQRLEMITRVARQVYPMRTVGGTSRLASARGVVWVCGQHQRWYLSVQGLEPAPAGSVYTLWFLTDHGPVNGGVIEVSGSRPGELAASFMPDGTHSFQVTLETDFNGTAPGGKPVMVADRSLEI